MFDRSHKYVSAHADPYFSPLYLFYCNLFYFGGIAVWSGLFEIMGGINVATGDEQWPGLRGNHYKCSVIALEKSTVKRRKHRKHTHKHSLSHTHTINETLFYRTWHLKQTFAPFILLPKCERAQLFLSFLFTRWIRKLTREKTEGQGRQDTRSCFLVFVYLLPLKTILQDLSDLTLINAYNSKFDCWPYRTWRHHTVSVVIPTFSCRRKSSR